jgi:3'-phosphoadenosine 5'-phosphosulfate sulfotransferase (PAPS reductase)/FAD synthetase
MEKLFKLEKEAVDIIKSFDINRLFLSFSGGIDSTVINYIIKKNKLPIKHIFFNKDVENVYNRKIINKVIKQYKYIHKAEPKLTYNEIVYEYGFPIGNKNFSKMCYRLNSYYNNLNVNNLRDTFRIITGYTIKDIINDKKISNLYKLNTKFFYLAIKYPIQEKCCNILKKEPSKKIIEKGLIPIIGIMKSDSPARRKAIELNYTNKKKCFPLANWTKKDVIDYVQMENIEVSKSYEDRYIDNITIKGNSNTGCIGCHFGQNTNHCIIKNNKEIKISKFDIIKIERPKMYKSIMNMQHKSGIKFKQVIDIYNLSKKGYFLNESRLLKNKLINKCINLLNNLTEEEENKLFAKYNLDNNVIKKIMIDKLLHEINFM